MLTLPDQWSHQRHELLVLSCYLLEFASGHSGKVHLCNDCTKDTQQKKTGFRLVAGDGLYHLS